MKAMENCIIFFNLISVAVIKLTPYTFVTLTVSGSLHTANKQINLTFTLCVNSVLKCTISSQNGIP